MWKFMQSKGSGSKAGSKTENKTEAKKEKPGSSQDKAASSLGTRKYDDEDSEPMSKCVCGLPIDPVTTKARGNGVCSNCSSVNQTSK